MFGLRVFGQQCGTSPASVNLPQVAGVSLPGDPLTLRLYIFVIRTSDNDVASGASDADVQRVYNQLNLDYAPHNIRFALACVEILPNSALYYQPTLSISSSVAHEDGINLFLSTLDDGTFSGSAMLGGKSCWSRYDITHSHVPTHEVGHVLSLHHTFRGTPCSIEANAGGTDEVDDTKTDWGTYPNFPNCEAWTPLSNCDNVPRPNPGTNILRNYMAYNNDGCKSLFTLGQETRMRGNIAAAKQNMLIPNAVVTSSMTFNSQEYFFNTDIVIKAPAVLTFDACTLRMAALKRIIVEPGARLIIQNHALITNWPAGNCINQSGYWGGIILKNNGITSTSTSRVTVNYSTIENAICAFFYNVIGGRLPTVNSKESIYHNNQSVINFRVDNPNNVPVALSNTFNLCTFEWTSDYAGPEFYTMVDLRRVKGITYFLGCTFSNQAQSVFGDTGKITYGINASPDSKLIVDASSTNGVSTFSIVTGFYYGISATNAISSVTTTNIQRTLFQNNRESLRIRNTRGARVAFNTFRNSSPFYTNVNGLTLDNCTGYTINDNEFNKEGDGTALPFRGMIIQNSGIEDNLIAKNKFKNQRRGLLVEGTNRSPSPDNRGLYILCNEFESNIPGDIDIAGTIAQEQGALDRTAGNTFTSITHDFDYNNIGGGLINYYHFNSAQEKPDPVFNVNRISLDQSLTYCNIPPIDGLTEIGKDLVMAQTEYLQKKILFDNSKASLTSLLDGGNTTNLLSQINVANSSNSTSLNTTLLGISPYLSESVLEAAFERSDIFSTTTRFNLLYANPDVLKSKSFMEMIIQSEQPLSESQISSLKAISLSSTPRTYAQAEVSMNGLNKDMIVHSVISTLLSDSNQNFVALRTWLGYLNSFVAALNIADTYQAEGNITGWQQQVAAMATGAYTSTELSDLANYVTFHTILQNAQAQGRNVTMLNPTEVAQINTIVLTNNQYVSGITKAFLEIYYGYTYPSAYNMGENIERSENQPQTPTAAPLNTTKILSVYPNPAGETIVFELIDNKTSNGKIELYDTFGRLVFAEIIAGKSLLLNTHAAGMPLGLYQYRLTQNGAVLQSGKIIIR